MIALSSMSCPWQHYLIGALRIELLQPGTSLILRPE